MIDANQNGNYDAATDGLDSGSPGFVEIADAQPPTGIIALIGLLCVIGTFMIGKRFN